jgi:hypothetical protein
MIASRLWEWAVKPGVLPIANYEIEMAMRREVEQRKEKTKCR